MVLVVPDASVILKWVLPPDNEPFSEQAIELREYYLRAEIGLAVPSLWRFEVLNTLARRYPQEARRQIQDLHLLGMKESVVSKMWLERALRLTYEHGVAFYDASYHALAIVESGVFVSADERYLRAVGEHSSVCHLADWTP